MSAFTGTLMIEELVPGRRWRLAQPLVYEAGSKGSGRFIIVPAGFETDGASIPAALHLVLAVWGSYGRAACLHDYLYSVLRAKKLVQADCVSGGDVSHPAFGAWDDFYRSGDTVGETVMAARAWADGEFHAAMRACGTGRLIAFVLWAAVRVFGETSAATCRDKSP